MTKTFIPKSPAGLPQNGELNLFNVQGGRILVHAFFGEFKAGVINVPCPVKLLHDPVGSPVDLCLPLDLNGDGLGKLYTITGNPADELQRGAGVLLAHQPIIFLPGISKVHCGGNPPVGRHSFAWGMLWEKLDSLANVTAL